LPFLAGLILTKLSKIPHPNSDNYLDKNISPLVVVTQTVVGPQLWPTPLVQLVRLKVLVATPDLLLISKKETPDYLVHSVIVSLPAEVLDTKSLSLSVTLLLMELVMLVIS
jgi:hypothetical protein